VPRHYLKWAPLAVAPVAAYAAAASVAAYAAASVAPVVAAPQPPPGGAPLVSTVPILYGLEIAAAPPCHSPS